MSKLIDAVGKACPIPVIMTKKEIDNGEESIIIKVDNKIAVENLKKLATNTNFSVEVKADNNIFFVAFSKECEECNKMLNELVIENTAPKSDYVVFIGKEYIGEGNEELGKNLMRMFFYTLTESKEIPTHILLMNGGVKLATLDNQTVEHLKVLVDKGVDVLVCGACLNFYDIADELKVGSVSNMYDIVTRMQLAEKVLSF